MSAVILDQDTAPSRSHLEFSTDSDEYFHSCASVAGNRVYHFA